MQSVFWPAARRPSAGHENNASSPRRWAQNVLDYAAARMLAYGD